MCPYVFSIIIVYISFFLSIITKDYKPVPYLCALLLRAMKIKVKVFSLLTVEDKVHLKYIISVT